MTGEWPPWFTSAVLQCFFCTFCYNCPKLHSTAHCRVPLLLQGTCLVYMWACVSHIRDLCNSLGWS